MSQVAGRPRLGALAGIKVREAGGELIIEADGRHRRTGEGAESPFGVRSAWFITVRDGQLARSDGPPAAADCVNSQKTVQKIGLRPCTLRAEAEGRCDGRSARHARPRVRSARGRLPVTKGAFQEREGHGTRTDRAR
jgi:hypothetical protein